MLLESKRRAAGVLILALGLALALALLPYISGLLAGPVLYVLWLPLHEALTRRGLRPGLSAGIILALTLLLLVLPGLVLLTLLLGETQGAIESVMAGPVLSRLEQLQVGAFRLGPVLAQAGNSLLQWLGANAFTIIGTATRYVLGLLFMLVGLYYLLLSPGKAWQTVAPYIPVTAERAEALRDRFHAVTWSTVVGTGLNALVQGTLVAVALALAGFPNVVFWGTVTAVLSILPLVGTSLVWGPAALSLLLDGRVLPALGLVAWGALVVANVDSLLRPWVYRRYAHVHPMITLVGAVVGVEFFGLVGLVLGPLAIQYFFELIRMFREEHVEGWWEG